MGIEDRDGYREARRPIRRRPHGVLDAWWRKAVLGALVVIVTAMAAWALRLWMAERAFERMQRTVLESTTKIQRQALAASERLQADPRRQQALREARERMRRHDMADADSERARAYRREVAERERKERAWADFYKTPVQCEGPYEKIGLGDCAKRHIRAKKAFEAAYAAGAL